MMRRWVQDPEPDVRFVGYLTFALLAFVAVLLVAGAWGRWGQCAPLLGQAVCAWLFGR